VQAGLEAAGAPPAAVQAAGSVQDAIMGMIAQLSATFAAI
jgi:hypothetical protein